MFRQKEFGSVGYAHYVSNIVLLKICIWS